VGTVERTVPEAGIHTGVSFPQYLAWDAINWHTLWSMRKKCPADALYEREHGTDETAAKAFGSLTDFVLLEPKRFAETAVVEPEIGEGKAPKRPTARQINAKNPSQESQDAIAFWRQWDEANADKIIVSRKDYDQVMELAARIRAAQCREYICGGRSQVCIVWKDPETGLLCKGRLDYEREAGWNHFITDLKTSRCAHPNFWRWAIEEYGYYGQLAWYEWGWRTLTGEPSLCGWLIAQTQGCPQVVYYDMCDKDDLSLHAWRMVFREELNRWAECVKKNTWPGYANQTVGLSDYALRNLGIGPEHILPEPVETEPQDTRTFEEIYEL